MTMHGVPSAARNLRMANAALHQAEADLRNAGSGRAADAVRTTIDSLAGVLEQTDAAASGKSVEPPPPPPKARPRGTPPPQAEREVV